MRNIASAERVSAKDLSDNYVFQRSQLAYYRAAEIVSGKVLEIGTGNGYGIAIVSPHTQGYMTVDKFEPASELSDYDNVEYVKLTVPPFTGIASGSFDYVITFQVIEHIDEDLEFIREVERVLRPGGRLVITTPNRKMSLTRNPWHVREYTVDQFKNLISSRLNIVEALGVFGNDKVMSYYEKNRRAVESVTRFDVFDLQHNLPGWMLRIPYDILNRMNRRRLLIANRRLTSEIAMSDYYFAPAGDGCFDLFFVAEKPL